MGTIHGTEGDDRILRDHFSPGVTSDPGGLTGTDPGHSWDVIYGYGGDDIIVFGYESDIAYGGDGDDRIDAREAGHVSDAYHILFGDAGDDVVLGSDTRDYLDLAFDGSTDQAEGADTLIGGLGDDLYGVDGLDDVVIERAGGGDDSVFVMSLTSYVLRANFEDVYMWTDHSSVTGNAGDNFIYAWGSSTLRGGSGDDLMLAYTGRNLLIGGSGDDQLYVYDSEWVGFHPARDTLRGGSGDDILIGDEGADCLIGGTGADVFTYDEVLDSVLEEYRDEIRAGDHAKAFEKPGAAKGDLIDVSAIDANIDTAEFENFVFGGTGAGTISVVDQGVNSLVRGNINDDADFEFQILIRDGCVHASAYTAEDFILSA